MGTPKLHVSNKTTLNALKIFNRLASLNRRLGFQSRRFGLDYEARAIVQEACIGGPRVEDGETFTYPTTFELKIEGRSNRFYSVRIVDGRLIPEGRTLSGPGRTLADVYRSVLRELKEHAAAIKLSEQAERENGVVFNGKIIPVVGCAADAWFNRETKFLIQTTGAEHVAWFGNSPRDAISNAAPFLKEILKVSLHNDGGQS